jgi:UDP-N-acetyl-D-mannosaminuronate dehydrogenase
MVVLRSTVLPGTAETIVVPALEKASGSLLGEHFGVSQSRVHARRDRSLGFSGAVHDRHWRS